MWLPYLYPCRLPAPQYPPCSTHEWTAQTTNNAQQSVVVLVRHDDSVTLGSTKAAAFAGDFGRWQPASHGASFRGCSDGPKWLRISSARLRDSDLLVLTSIARSSRSSVCLHFASIALSAVQSHTIPLIRRRCTNSSPSLPHSPLLRSVYWLSLLAYLLDLTHDPSSTSSSDRLHPRRNRKVSNRDTTRQPGFLTWLT